MARPSVWVGMTAAAIAETLRSTLAHLLDCGASLDAEWRLDEDLDRAFDELERLAAEGGPYTAGAWALEDAIDDVVEYLMATPVIVRH